MRLNDIREIAKKKGVAWNKLEKIELIRMIQKTEGNTDCYETISVRECNQLKCLWRTDCVKTARS
jgi:hypothetical protein